MGAFESQTRCPGFEMRNLDAHRGTGIFHLFSMVLTSSIGGVGCEFDSLGSSFDDRGIAVRGHKTLRLEVRRIQILGRRGN